ncbi:hypothetical protein EFR84_30940 [Rhizobium chutanense]|uniref:Uncharacterized protein n=1 Tax=Rhizobium chutanense TaxID=2035448 RepID=A0A432ND44_9HYPH|nr:hypothetical protein EFR84_30940 [Rhizobium chutanense]
MQRFFADIPAFAWVLNCRDGKSAWIDCLLPHLPFGQKNLVEMFAIHARSRGKIASTCRHLA